MKFKKEATKKKIISVLKRNVAVLNRWRILSGRTPDLSYADLRSADLRDADLRDADLDFSCMGFSCKTLETKYDNKHIIQILYHAGKPCENNHIELDADTKKLLNSKMFKKVINKFHRAEECGIFGGTK